MRISVLLKNLFDIANVQKTDFALAMNISPSSLSKILSGKTIPIEEEKNQFSKKASHFFAENIYEEGCYIKFKNIFPVLYDFSSMYELKVFLIYAIDYALENDYCFKKNTNLFEHNNRACSFIGRESVLNMTCIIISDYHRKNIDKHVEINSSLRLFSQLYNDIFKHIKFNNTNDKNDEFGRLEFNHYFDMDTLEETYKNSDFCMLEKIINSKQKFNLNFYETKLDKDSSFLLMKDTFLLLFNVLLDGTLIMTFINKDSYLSKFHNSLNNSDIEKISYNREEAVSLLENNPIFLEELTKKPIERIYSFLPVGFFVEKSDLDINFKNENIYNLINKIFDKIKNDDMDIYVSTDMITDFLINGKVIVPFIDILDIKPDKRIDYYTRSDKYLDDKNMHHIKIIDSKLPKFVFLSYKDLSLLYLIDNDYKNEKVHIFKTNIFNEMIKSRISNKNIHMIELNSVIRDIYLKNYSKKFFDINMESI